MLNEVFQIAGDKNNPYHLSVGIVLEKDSKVVLIKKKSGDVTLPRETIHSNESILEGLKRGAYEELGMRISLEKFIGSLLTYFFRADDTKIEKTTLYFKCSIVDEGLVKNQMEDEIEDEIIFETLEVASQLLKSSNNPEWQIIERIKAD